MLGLFWLTKLDLFPYFSKLDLFMDFGAFGEGLERICLFKGGGNIRLKVWIHILQCLGMMFSSHWPERGWPGGSRNALRRPDRREGTRVIDSNPRVDKLRLDKFLSNKFFQDPAFFGFLSPL